MNTRELEIKRNIKEDQDLINWVLQGEKPKRTNKYDRIKKGVNVWFKGKYITQLKSKDNKLRLKSQDKIEKFIKNENFFLKEKYGKTFNKLDPIIIDKLEKERINKLINNQKKKSPIIFVKDTYTDKKGDTCYTIDNRALKANQYYTDLYQEIYKEQEKELTLIQIMKKENIFQCVEKPNIFKKDNVYVYITKDKEIIKGSYKQRTELQRNVLVNIEKIVFTLEGKQRNIGLKKLTWQKPDLRLIGVK